MFRSRSPEDSNKMNPKKSTPRQIIIKFPKKGILKVAKEKQHAFFIRELL